MFLFSFCFLSYCLLADARIFNLLYLFSIFLPSDIIETWNFFLLMKYFTSGLNFLFLQRSSFARQNLVSIFIFSFLDVAIGIMFMHHSNKHRPFMVDWWCLLLRHRWIIEFGSGVSNSVSSRKGRSQGCINLVFEETRFEQFGRC